MGCHWPPLPFLFKTHSRNHIGLLFIPYFKNAHSWNVIDLILFSVKNPIFNLHQHWLTTSVLGWFSSTGVRWTGLCPCALSNCTLALCALVCSQTAPWPCAPLCVVKLMSSVWNLFLFLGNNDRALCISWCKRNITAPWPCALVRCQTAPWPCAPLCVVKLHLDLVRPCALSNCTLALCALVCSQTAPWPCALVRCQTYEFSVKPLFIPW